MLREPASRADGWDSAVQRAVLSELDCDRFGLQIARVDDIGLDEVRGVTRSCLDRGIEMVIARCAADDFPTIHALERAGYMLMETQVHYLGPVVSTVGSTGVRDAVTADADAVERVARAAFADYGGHYHCDPRLPAAQSTEAYVSWAANCMNGRLAEHVVVAELDGRIVGFQAHRSPQPGTGQLLLIGVAPEARGRGIYHALGSHAMRWSSQRGCSELLAVCHQGNLASHRVFIGLGLRPAQAVSTFHGWADDLRARLSGG